MLSEPLPVDPSVMDEATPLGFGATNQFLVEGDIQIDLQNYISSYHGYIHYQRLLFIAERCPSLRGTALRLAHDYIKQHTMDTTTYNKIFLMLAEEVSSTISSAESFNGTSTRTFGANSEQLQESPLLPGAGEVLDSNSTPKEQALAIVTSGNNSAKIVYDAQWETSTRRKSAILLDQLDTELKNFKANSIKESIRRGFDDLGDRYLKCGQLANARKCYCRSQDYCTSQQQEITMCLNVIKVAIFQRSWAQVSSYVTRAFSLSEMQDATSASGIATNSLVPSHFRGKPPGSSRMSSSAGLGRTAAADGPTWRTTTEDSTHTGGSPDPLSRRSHSRQQFGDSVIPPSVSGGQSYRDTMFQARTQLSIANGLVELAAHNFRGAALSFLQVNPDYCESPTSSAVTQSDLAYFVTLCTLATFDRTELANQVLGSPHVRLLLEAEPTCRDILYAFHQANYAACLGRLNKISNLLRLDIFLADHVTVLCGEIRNRALCQYFSPYSSVDLNRMAQAFDTTVANLEDELAVLIQEGCIKARIDSHKQLLRALNVDQRCLTFARAQRLVDEYKRYTQSMILRMSLSRQKLACQAHRDETDMTWNFLS